MKITRLEMVYVKPQWLFPRVHTDVLADDGTWDTPHLRHTDGSVADY